MLLTSHPSYLLDEGDTPRLMRRESPNIWPTADPLSHEVATPSPTASPISSPIPIDVVDARTPSPSVPEASIQEEMPQTEEILTPKEPSPPPPPAKVEHEEPKVEPASSPQPWGNPESPLSCEDPHKPSTPPHEPVW